MILIGDCAEPLPLAVFTSIAWYCTVKMDQDICVGSMGLHQNNLVNHYEDGGAGAGACSLQSHHSATSPAVFPWNMSSRSVIDVFRGIRDRYFGKPVLPKMSERKTSLRCDKGIYQD